MIILLLVLVLFPSLCDCMMQHANKANQQHYREKGPISCSLGQ